MSNDGVEDYADIDIGLDNNDIYLCHFNLIERLQQIENLVDFLQRVVPKMLRSMLSRHTKRERAAKKCGKNRTSSVTNFTRLSKKNFLCCVVKHF